VGDFYQYKRNGLFINTIQIRKILAYFGANINFDDFYRKHSIPPSAFLTHKNWLKLRMLLKSRWGVKIGWVKQTDNGIKQEI